jgi:hypothetical protein
MHFNRPRKTFLNFEFLICLKWFLFGFKNNFFNRCRLQRLNFFTAVADIA